ncbi:hypothetical protein D3C84_942500 [compost metagenome]
MGLASNSTLKFYVNVIEVEFTMFEQNQGSRPASQDLPTQLRTDRPACASYHHYLIANAAFEQLLARRDRIPTE